MGRLMDIEDIDRYCDLFEQQIKSGDVESVEQFCLANHLPENPKLLYELKRIKSEYSGNRKSARVDSATTAGFGYVGSASGNRYVDLQPFKQGGFGEVLKATDSELHREVALKRLKNDHASEKLIQRRFMLEAEITARLEHPGVVPVYGLFQDESGRICYTMRLIEGETLNDAINAFHRHDADPVALRRLLQSFIQVCQTLAYAHSRGVIHRDLKPQNIMLGKFNETMVVDWGLAKTVGRTDEDLSANLEQTLHPMSGNSGESIMGSALGTPSYMSPEQAAGRWDVIDQSSDVYNLGAVLYTILTGKPPVSGDNWPEIQQKIQRGDFPDPRNVQPAVPRSLEAVCLKAMALNPEDRYSTAKALAHDVECWLADEPVAAFTEPIWASIGRWTRHHRVLVSSLIGLMMTLVTLGVSLWILNLQAAKANLNFQLAAQDAMINEVNGQSNDQMMRRSRDFVSAAEEAFDKITSQLNREESLNLATFQPIRNALFDESIQFWNRAIELDRRLTGTNTGRRTAIYRRNRALCFARMGNHQMAIKEVNELGNDQRTMTGEAVFDLARICAVCASAVTSDVKLSERYAEHAFDFLKQAHEMGFFMDPATELGALSPIDRLRQDPDIDFLRQRNDFRNLISEIESDQVDQTNGPTKN